MNQKDYHSCEGFRQGQKHTTWHSSVHCGTMLPPLNLHLPHNLLYIIADGVGWANFRETDNDLLNRKACYHYSKRWSLDLGHDFWWFRQAKNILKALSLDPSLARWMEAMWVPQWHLWSQVLDLSHDDSGGIEFSLILFSFPRNVLLEIIIDPSTLVYPLPWHLVYSK